MSLTKITNRLVGSSLKTAISGSDIAESSSFSTRTTALESDSGSFSTRTTALESDSGSFSTRTTTVEGRVNQGVKTTDSPTFAGATINGTLTASEIHTTFVSSSVATITGSNVFGDAVGDLHSFTGSVSISGSQTSLVTAGNVDFNGDLDVDGTTNLDAVDIDGNVDIAGTLTTAGSTGSDYIGSFTNTSGTGWGLFIKGGADNADYTLRIQDKDTADLLSVKAGGRVGVLTNDPSHTMVLKTDSGGSTNVLKIEEKDSTDALVQLSFGGDYDEGSIHVYNGGTSKINLRGNGASYFNGGNVGIGTTGPGATLHVDDDSSTAYNGAAEVGETVIFRNKNGSDDSGVNNVVSIGLQVADGATSQGFINYVRTGNNTGEFTFSQRTASSTYAEHMRIDSSGNVGIGTNNPGSVLHVRVGSNQNLGFNSSSSVFRLSAFNDAVNANVPLLINASSLRFGISDSEKMRIDSSGNVGIGVTPDDEWDTFTAMQIGEVGAIFAHPDGTGAGSAIHITANAYYDSRYEYLITDEASRYTQENGKHLFYVASSGTHGNPITFTEIIEAQSGQTKITGNLINVGYAETRVTSNNTGHDFKANWDSGFINSIDSYFDGASAASSYMRFKIASGAGTQATTLEMNGDGSSTFSGSVRSNTGFLTNEGNLRRFASLTINDNNINNVAQVNQKSFLVYVNDSAGGFSSIVLHTGGSGIAYNWHMFDTDSNTWFENASTITSTGTNGNTYNFSFNTGNGYIRIQRTNGSLSFDIRLYQIFE